MILSLQLLGHHAQGEGEYKIQEGREQTRGKSLPGRQGSKNISCWVLRGEAESRGHGRGGVTWAAPPFHPPQSGGWGEVLNNQKSLGEISEQRVCFLGKCWDVFKKSPDSTTPLLRWQSGYGSRQRDARKWGPCRPSLHCPFLQAATRSAASSFGPTCFS